MTVEDKIFAIDFFTFVQQNMAQYKNVFEAREAYKKLKGK